MLRLLAAKQQLQNRSYLCLLELRLSASAVSESALLHGETAASTPLEPLLAE